MFLFVFFACQQCFSMCFYFYLHANNVFSLCFTKKIEIISFCVSKARNLQKKCVCTPPNNKSHSQTTQILFSGSESVKFRYNNTKNTIICKLRVEKWRLLLQALHMNSGECSSPPCALQMQFSSWVWAAAPSPGRRQIRICECIRRRAPGHIGICKCHRVWPFPNWGSA